VKQDYGIVILAAGLGTRMKSRYAKVLHQAGGQTLIELTVGAARQLTSPECIYVVVGHQAAQVRRVLEGSGVQFIPQTEQLGTGHAVLIGREALQGWKSLLVFYGDCPLIPAETLAGLQSRHTETGAAATLVSTRLANPTGYGRILRGSGGEVRQIVEEKTATAVQKAITEINAGIYCFETGPLFECLAALRPSAAGEYYLTDVIGCFVARGLRVEALLVEDATLLLGVNTRTELAAADRILRARKIEALLNEGVTIQKPETVTVDAGVEMGSDTVLEPFVQVLGHSTIGSGCRIGSHSILRNATLGEDVTIEAFCWVHDSRLERGAQIGPYARLRPGNIIGAEARVGNFVELKKTRLGARSKAQHLSYLGDAVIGANVNVGAGTITCNFDGIAKHATTVEDGVFIGSHATLVAPLKVGEGAYLAAGSVFTEEVPPGALGIARSRQTNKPGWAASRRKQGKGGA
jgi:bifunctional UDP-N-acetylglucosamine pyrophosphorylase/glucosamine-1-phosphate N-acetyltransferase